MKSKQISYKGKVENKPVHSVLAQSMVRDVHISSQADLSNEVPFYVRTHSDSFSEPLHISDAQLQKLTRDRSQHGSPSNHKGEPSDIQSSRSSSSSKLSKTRTKKWYSSLFSELEPRESWMLLFFRIIPVNMLFGINMIMFGFYVVEYVEYFNISSSVVGIIAMLKTGIMSTFG